jgi:hypothetical protein
MFREKAETTDETRIGTNKDMVRLRQVALEKGNFGEGMRQ